MTDIVISIQPSPAQSSNSHRQISASETPAVVNLKPITPGRRILGSNARSLFLPATEGVELELPPPKLLAETSYQAQLPRHTYATTYDAQPAPDRGRVASAARVYARQLNMVVYRLGLFVDCYA